MINLLKVLLMIVVLFVGVTVLAVGGIGFFELVLVPYKAWLQTLLP